MACGLRVRASSIPSSGRRPYACCEKANPRIRDFRVLGQEAVAGVDCVRAAALRRSEYCCCAQVAFRRLRRPYFEGTIGQLGGETVGIRSAVGEHRANSQFTRGAHDTNRNLASVCNEKRRDLPRRRAFQQSSVNSDWPALTTPSSPR
jgi:hypothetical protein